MEKLHIIKEKIRKNKSILVQRYNVKKIGIFGSHSRGSASKASDVDILVSFSQTPDIFEFIRLEEFFKNLLGSKVDLVTPGALKPLIRENILKETTYL